MAAAVAEASQVARAVLAADAEVSATVSSIVAAVPPVEAPSREAFERSQAGPDLARWHAYMHAF